jgi:hypothetical protein
MSCRVLTAALTAALGVLGAASVERPFPGITVITRTETAPRKFTMHVVLVDLTVQGIRFKLTGPAGSLETLKQTTLEFLEQEGAQVAINAHFFLPFPSEGNEANLVGFAASNGTVFSGCEHPSQSHAIVANAPAMNIDPRNRVAIVHCDADQDGGKRVKEPVKIWNTVAGSAQIVADGAATIPALEWYQRVTARSAIGISKDGNTLALFTADRLTVGEVAQILIRDYGVHNALNLDGGGSATLAIQDPKTFEGRVLNSPAGSADERRVGSNLAVFAPLTTPGQNPSPMVEHTRPHPRAENHTAAGRREQLSLGTLFLPERLRSRRGTAPLLFFFHGGTLLPETAAARNGTAVVSIQIGAGSGVYVRAFQDPTTFAALIEEAESKAGLRFAPITLAGWSAGCGAIRQIMGVQENYDRVANVLMIDGIHTGYTTGKPGPLESGLDTENLDVYVKLGRDAMAGRKRVMITHSEIFPGTFASTTETADYIVSQLGLKRRPMLKTGPMGTQQLSEVRAGRFALLGYAGNSAPDHVDQLHSLGEYLRRMR